MKIRHKEKVKRILFITLSNIGDIILTTPALSILRREFPDAGIDVLSGPNGEEIFSNHPFVAKFILYDKFSKLQSKKYLIRALRKNRYDLIIDLRNSLFPFLIGSRYRTAVVYPFSRDNRAVHKKEEHLFKLKELGLDIDGAQFAFYIDSIDEAFVKDLLANSGIKKDFVVVSPGAKSHIKRWTKEGFGFVCDRIIDELNCDVIMAGDRKDKEIIFGINSIMKNKKAIDLSSKLNLRQLGALIERSRLLITNDSAPMHIGHAVGAKVLAIFGPTDPEKYGPRGKYDVVIKEALTCSPCEVAQCKKNHECMNLIDPSRVFQTVKDMVSKI
jgi:heptosyltransferase II